MLCVANRQNANVLHIGTTVQGQLVYLCLLGYKAKYIVKAKPVHRICTQCQFALVRLERTMLRRNITNS